MNATEMVASIELLQEAALASLNDLSAVSDLEKWRLEYLGRQGLLTTMLRNVSTVDADERPLVGAVANRVKHSLVGALTDKEVELKREMLSTLTGQKSIDVTLPGRPINRGRLHPTTQTVREICTAFISMGFQVFEGPEVEWDKYNFEMLNIPKDHPARDMWDTLWIDDSQYKAEYSMLLRTHTSPMQARVMEKTEPPIRVVVPGKCYRYEATDATHEWHFYQIEGLAVDEGVTFADLKGTLYEFARRLFGVDRKVRFRCDYFPFVEPGVEMAIDCFICAGNGCRICSNSGWIEIMGAGMVHPKVLSGVGYDPQKYTGFAFGLGVERIAMLKYGIDDIRHFYSNDLRFLRQF